MGKNDDGDRFEFRTGFGGTYGGMLTEGDPAQNGPWRPRMVVNARLVAGEYRERAGLAKLDENAIDSAGGKIKNILSFNLATPKPLWIIGNGCPGISTSAGYSLVSLDPEQDPEVQAQVYDSGLGTEPIIAKYGESWYLAASATLYLLQPLRTRWGTEALDLSGTSQQRPIHTFTGYTIKCMFEFDGSLFIGLDNGNGASKVSTWNGISIQDETGMTAIDPPTCMAAYRIQDGGDALVMGTSNANTIYIRNTAGTWSTIGAIASVQMLAYKDVLYIATGSTALYSWNGTTLASARSPALTSEVRGVAVFNGYLYFCYTTSTPASIIGKYDGSTWTDAEKNLTTQLGAGTDVRDVEYYRDMLIASGARSGGKLWVSPGTSTSGTWVEVNPDATTGTLVRLVA